MLLNTAGKIAEECWKNIPNHFPHTKLHEFVIMPNHVHGIIEITENRGGVAGGNGALSNHVGARLIASPHDLITTNEKTNNNKNKIPGGATGKCNPMFYQNISRVIRWYKGRCSFEIRKVQADFKWQSRFHDHIIRDHDSYLRIANYIINNPSKWEADKSHKSMQEQR